MFKTRPYFVWTNPEMHIGKAQGICSSASRPHAAISIQLLTQDIQATNRLVSRSLVHTQHLQQLHSLVQTHHHVLNGRNVASIFNKLHTLVDVGKAEPADDALIQELASALLQRVAAEEVTLTGPQVAQIVYSMVKIGVTQAAPWLPDALFAHELGFYACNELELTRLLWAVVKLEVPIPRASWLDEVAKVGASKVHLFDSCQLARFGWSLLQLKYQPSPYWLGLYTNAARRWLVPPIVAHPNHIALIMWVLGCWKPRLRQDWYNDMFAYFEQTWDQLEWVSFVQLLRGLAIARAEPPNPWLDQCCQCTRASFALSTPRGDTQFLWALAMFNHQVDPVVMSELLFHIQPRLCTYSGRELGTLMWSLTRLKYVPPEDWLRVLLDQAQKQLASFTATALCSHMVALKQWQLLPSKRYSMRLIQCMQSKLPSFSSAQLATTVVCLGHLHLRTSQTWAHKLLEEFARKQPDVKPYEVATIVFSLHRLVPAKDMIGLSESASKPLHSIAFNATCTIQQYSPRNLLLLLLGFARIQFWPGDRFWEAAIGQNKQQQRIATDVEQLSFEDAFASLQNVRQMDVVSSLQAMAVEAH